MFGAEFTAPLREPWMDDALCAEVDPDVFFPEKGGSTRDAKKVCAACPVRAMCLDYALANKEYIGIWGGLSERERRQLRRSMPAQLTPLQQREQALRKFHADGLMDTEMAPLLGTSAKAVGRDRAALGLPANGAGGYRKSAMKSDPRSRAKKQEEPMVEAAKPAKWSVRKVWVAIAPDGTMHGPFDDQGASLGFVGRQLRPVARREEPARPAGEKAVRRAWTEDEVQSVRDLHAEGLSDTAIGKQIGRPQPDVSRWRRKLGLPAHGSFGSNHEVSA